MKERIRCAQCDGVKNHPDHTYDHDFVDPRPVGMNPIGKRMQRFNASPAGQEYQRSKQEMRGNPCQTRDLVGESAWLQALADGLRCKGYGEHWHEILPRGRAGGLEAALRLGPKPVWICDPCNGHISEHSDWAEDAGVLMGINDIGRGEMEIEI